MPLLRTRSPGRRQHAAAAIEQRYSFRAFVVWPPCAPGEVCKQVFCSSVASRALDVPGGYSAILGHIDIGLVLWPAAPTHADRVLAARFVDSASKLKMYTYIHMFLSTPLGVTRAYFEI